MGAVRNAAIEQPAEVEDAERSEERATAFLLWALVGGLAAAVVWASNRGLDLTDEGYYLQLYSHPDAVPTSADWSQFYVLVDLLNGPFQPPVVVYRLVGLAATLGIAVLFGVAVLGYIARFLPTLAAPMPPKRVTLAFIALTGLLGYVWVPLTPGYNTVATVLVGLGGAAALAALTTESIGARMALMAGLGAVTPFLFFTKFPAAILLLVSVAVFATVTLGWRSAAPAVFVSVAVASIVAILVTEEFAGNWFSLDGLRESASLVASNDVYSISEVVTNSSLGLVAVAMRPLVESPLRVVALVLVFTAGPLTSLATTDSRRARRLAWMLRIAGALYLLAELPTASYITDFFGPSEFVVVIPAALVVLTVAAAYHRGGRLPDLSLRGWPRSVVLVVWLILGLLGLAVLPAVGTNNTIATNIMISSAPLGAATVVVVAAAVRDDARESRIQWRFVLPIVAVLMAAQVVNGVIVDPYRLGASRIDQTISAEGVANGSELLHAPDTAAALSNLAAVVDRTGFVPGDPILPIGWLPGIAYLLDATVPGAAWIPPPVWEDQAASCAGLRNDAARVAEVRVFVLHSAISPGLDTCLAELVPGYPDDVVEVGTVPFQIEYWDDAFSTSEMTVLEIRP